MQRCYSMVLGIAVGMLVMYIFNIYGADSMQLDTFEVPKESTNNTGHCAASLHNIPLESLTASSASFFAEQDLAASLEAHYEEWIKSDAPDPLALAIVFREHTVSSDFLANKLLSAKLSEQNALLEALAFEDEPLRVSVLKNLFENNSPQAIDVALNIIKHHSFTHASNDVERLLLHQSYHVDNALQVADIAQILNLRGAYAQETDEIAKRMDSLLSHFEPAVKVQAIAGIALYGSQFSLMSAIEQHLTAQDYGVRRAAIKAMYSLDSTWFHSHLVSEMEYIVLDPSEEASLRALAEDVIAFHDI